MYLRGRPSKERREKAAFDLAQAWNAKYPPGSVVHYLQGGAVVTTKTRSIAYNDNGMARVELAGQKRDVSLWSIQEGKKL